MSNSIKTDLNTKNGRNILMIINDSVLSSISTQLWRYYDIEIDIDEIYTGENGVYTIFGSTEKSKVENYLIKCKMFDDKVEE